MKTMAETYKRESDESGAQRATGWVAEKIAAIKEFYTETRHEMQRVTWPTRQQVQSTTIVVIVTVFFFGAFFGISDYGLGRLITWLFKRLAQG
jgi:preprotein translocase subunit SecE